MMKNTLPMMALCAAIILLISGPSLAQSQRGKIAGIVLDEKSKEPVIGANVLVEHTELGAVTDAKGRFFILNVPVGLHSVRVRYIGYAPYVVKDVEVNTDRTTELRVPLRDAALQLEQVTVVAKRPDVIKDQTSSTSTLNADQIKSAPVEGVRGALELAADLQRTATGNLSVRGSGSYDVNFQINGIDQVSSATNSPGSFGTEKANNSWKYDVNPLGVSQVQLITGGFSAEYGNAQAGVVKVVMKEGTSQLHGEFRTEYRPAGQYHYGDYLYSQNTYEWRRWGKIENWMSQRSVMISELKLDTRYESLYKKINNRTASASDSASWNTLVNNEITWAYNMWIKNHTPSDDNPLGVYDYTQYAYKRYMFGFGGPLGKDPNLVKFYFSGEYRSNPTRLPTPEKNQIYQNYILNLSAMPITGHKFKFMGSFQKYRGGLWSGSEDIRWSGIAFNPPGLSTKYYITTDPVRTEQTVAQSLNWVYTISQASFMELTVAHQSEYYSLPYEYLTGWSAEADRLDSLNDSRGNVLKDGIWWDNTYFRPLFNFSTNYYQDTRTENWTITGDFTHQFSNGNLFKTGFRAYYWDLYNNGVNSSFLPNTYIARAGYAEFYHAYPFSVSFFVQDKLEIEGMVANFGLRAEAYNFNEGVPEDMFNVFYQGKDGANPANPGNPATVTSDTKFILMPRLGLSFPIGERTAFRLQYGHFASMPTFSHALSNRTQNGWTGLGNPNLNFRKTINYEFGLQQVLDDNQRLDIALYYNDRTQQVGLLRVASFVGSRERSAGFTNDGTQLFYYTTFDDNAYGSTMGISFTLETIRVEDWTYRLSYNLSRTTDGLYGAEAIYPDGRVTINKSIGEYISSTDRMHNFRGLVQYNLRDDEGFSIFGFKPFQNSVFGLTYSIQSGTPYTYVTSFTLQDDVVRNRRYPLESAFDFSFTKTILFDNYRIIAGLRVMNLFNNRWITPMGDSKDTDLKLWVEEGVTMADPGTVPDRLSYITAPFRAYRNIPRQIYFTLGFGF